MFNKIASTFFIKIVVAFINLAIVILLSKLIGAEGKGEATLVLTSIAMILLFCNIVGGPTLVYFVPRHNNLFLFVVSNIWSVIVCLFGFLILNFFSLIPSNFVLPVILLSLLNSFLATNINILLGKEEVGKANNILLLQALVNAIILLLFLFYIKEKSVWAYIYSLYAAFGLCFIISQLMIRKHIKIIDFKNFSKTVNELFKIGIINQLGHILYFMSFRFIYYIIVEYKSEAALGIFSNGNSITESILLITNSYITVIHPRISNSKDINYSREITVKYTRHSIILCVLALVIMMLLPESFWIVLFGKDFYGIRNVILFLCPGIFFYHIGLIVGHYFSGIGRPGVNALGNLIGLITTFSLVFFILPDFDLTKISVISSISYLTTTMVIVIYFLKESKLKIRNLFPTFNDLKDLKKDIFLIFKKQ